ncbi:hypothetical protein [Hymenobacter tenuis]
MPSSASNSAPDYVEFRHRDELGVLTGRWLRPVTAAELTHSYQAALSAALPTRTRYWLLDLRGRGPASEDDTHWVLTEFVPTLSAQLGGRAYLAFVVAASQLGPEEQETGSPMVLDETAHVRLFAAEEPALRWLNGRQHHDSA